MVHEMDRDGMVHEMDSGHTIRRDRAHRQVLRGSTVVSAPFTLAGLVCAAVAALSVTWVFATASADSPGWITAMVFAVLATGLLIAARGCRVLIDSGRIHDQVAWRTVWSSDAVAVVEVRVRRGPWRTFETEGSDGRRRVLLGAGPVQFPANLLPGAVERDLRAIDMLMGSMGSLQGE